MSVAISLTVNGKVVSAEVDARTLLVEFLRGHLRLTGTHVGCDTGHCGACTVHVDGKAARSCRVPIGRLEGSFIVTIEALSRDRSHPVQQAWVAESVPQCGYCQPGMIMAAAALLNSTANPTDAEIDAAITNICRCGTYPRIREAIRRAARVKAGQERIVAAPPPGIDPADAARTTPALRPDLEPVPGERIAD